MDLMKALLGMKFLIKDNVIQSEEAMLQMIKDIEVFDIL